MKCLNMIIFYFLCHLNINAGTYDSLIVWSQNYRITWDDFCGEPDFKLIDEYGEAFKAVTATIITRSFKITGNKLSHEVNCYFNKNKSWTVLKDSVLLEHERIHFDISELYKRKIIYAFDSLNALDMTDIKIFNEKYYNIMIEHDLEQSRYDQETWFGTFDEIQDIWKEEINIKLEDYYESGNFK